jgi:hypothetical protein
MAKFHGQDQIIRDSRTSMGERSLIGVQQDRGETGALESPGGGTAERTARGINPLK